MTKTNGTTIQKEKPFIKKYGGLFFIAGLIVFMLFLAIMGINVGQLMANIVVSFYNEYGFWGIYIGIFLISIFGNFTVIFPVPYTIALIVISLVVPGVNPILLGIAGGLGAGIGETSAWLIGRGSKELFGDSEKMERMKGYVDKGWAPLLIFIFAATPLPDDAFLIVLGLAEYSIVKTLVFCFLGKFVLCFLSSAIPIWFIDTAIGDSMLGLFGVNLEAAKTGVIPASTIGDLIKSTVMWSSTIIIMFLLVYVDWGKFFGKFKKNKEDPKAKTKSESKKEAEV